MAPRKKKAQVVIPPPNFKILETVIVGTAEMVQGRFSQEAQNQMREKMEAGSTAKKGARRRARDFEKDFNQSYYKSSAGWFGVPACLFRNAMISACRVVGFAMTRAKLSIFILQDGLDATDGTPLVKINRKPTKRIDPVRNATGVADLRARASYATGWEVKVRIRYDADQFTEVDILNLLMRCGIQVGIGNGRPDSKDSNGLGWGTFEIKSEKKGKVRKGLVEVTHDVA